MRSRLNNNETTVAPASVSASVSANQPKQKFTLMQLRIVDENCNYLSNIKPQVGMILACGSKVIKVNKNSMVIFWTDKDTNKSYSAIVKANSPTVQSIEATEAKRWGYIRIKPEILDNLIETVNKINCLITNLEEDHKLTDLEKRNNLLCRSTINIQQKLTMSMATLKLNSDSFLSDFLSSFKQLLDLSLVLLDSDRASETLHQTWVVTPNFLRLKLFKETLGKYSKALRALAN